MKVLDIKSGITELESIKFNDKSVIKSCLDYLRRYNDQYENLLLDNLYTLEAYQVDEMMKNGTLGEYYEENNKMFFSSPDAFCHEIMHVASYDENTGNMGFLNYSQSICGDALLEGFTEHYSYQAYTNYTSVSYVLPRIVAMVLSGYDNVTKSFFTANPKLFFDAFKNKTDIYSLMYSLDYYEMYVYDLTQPNDKKDIIYKEKFISSLKNIIDMIIKIENDKNKYISKSFYEMVMTEIDSNSCKYEVGPCYSKFEKYAYKELKKKIK